MAIVPVTGLGGTATANRLAVQAAIDAAAPGDTLSFPAGDWTFNNVPGSPTWAMRIAKPLTLRGAGLTYASTYSPPGGPAIPRISGGLTTLRMDAAEALSEGTFWLFLFVDTTDVVFEDLELHGQKPNSGQLTTYGPNQDPPLLREHGTGVFVNNCQRVTFRRCYFHDFIGDAVQNYNDTTDLLIEDCAVRWCQRDGITLSPTDLFRPMRRVIIRYTEITECSNQQIDNEHGAAHEVQVYGCLLSGGDGDYSIAAGGPDIDTEIYPDPIPLQSSRWHVHHNIINGSCYSAWLHDSTYEHNIGTNAGLAPLYEVNRASTSVTIRHNVQACSQNEVNNQSAVWIVGTAGSGPSGIVVEDNTFTMTRPQSFGIRADGCVSVRLRRNTLIGPGVVAAGYSGIRLRATSLTRLFVLAEVDGNTIKGWGQYGIAVAGNGAARIGYARFTGNIIGNDGGYTGMSIGISLDDGLGALLSGLVVDNAFGAGIVTQLANVPPLGVIAFAYPVTSILARVITAIAVVVDGSARRLGIPHDPRRAIALPRGEDLRLELGLVTSCGIPVELDLDDDDVLRFTVRDRDGAVIELDATAVTGIPGAYIVTVPSARTVELDQPRYVWDLWMKRSGLKSQVMGAAEFILLGTAGEASTL